MVVRIRLQRFGQRNLPFYRIVVANSKSPRDGKFLERVRTMTYMCTDTLLTILFNLYYVFFLSNY